MDEKNLLRADNQRNWLLAEYVVNVLRTFVDHRLQQLKSKLDEIHSPCSQAVQESLHDSSECSQCIAWRSTLFDFSVGGLHSSNFAKPKDAMHDPSGWSLGLLFLSHRNHFRRLPKTIEDADLYLLCTIIRHCRFFSVAVRTGVDSLRHMRNQIVNNCSLKWKVACGIVDLFMEILREACDIRDDTIRDAIQPWFSLSKELEPEDVLQLIKSSSFKQRINNIRRESLQIFLKSITGEITTVNVSDAMNIQQIKEEYQLGAKSKLIFAGKVLEDRRTLASYKIQDESTLYLVKQLRHAIHIAFEDWHLLELCRIFDATERMLTPAIFKYLNMDDYGKYLNAHGRRAIREVRLSELSVHLDVSTIVRILRNCFSTLIERMGLPEDSLEATKISTAANCLLSTRHSFAHITRSGVRIDEVTDVAIHLQDATSLFTNETYSDYDDLQYSKDFHKDSSYGLASITENIHSMNCDVPVHVACYFLSFQVLSVFRKDLNELVQHLRDEYELDITSLKKSSRWLHLPSFEEGKDLDINALVRILQSPQVGKLAKFLNLKFSNNVTQGLKKILSLRNELLHSCTTKATGLLPRIYIVVVSILKTLHRSTAILQLEQMLESTPRELLTTTNEEKLPSVYHFQGSQEHKSVLHSVHRTYGKRIQQLRNSHFMARTAELDKLRFLVDTDGGSVVLMGGAGGVGKTTLAVEFLKTVSREKQFDFVDFEWIDGTSLEALEDGLNRFGRFLLMRGDTDTNTKHEQDTKYESGQSDSEWFSDCNESKYGNRDLFPVEKAMSYLQKSSKWFLVVDNASIEAIYHLSGKLESGGAITGRLLILMRSDVARAITSSIDNNDIFKFSQDEKRISTMTLTSFAEEEATELMYRLFPQLQNDEGQQSLGAITAFVRKLDCNPLLIRLSASIMKHSKSLLAPKNIDEKLSWLSDSLESANVKDSESFLSPHERSRGRLQTVWAQNTLKTFKDDPSVMELLSTFALLGNQAIPLDLFPSHDDEEESSQTEFSPENSDIDDGDNDQVYDDGYEKAGDMGSDGGDGGDDGNGLDGNNDDDKDAKSDPNHLPLGDSGPENPTDSELLNNNLDEDLQDDSKDSNISNDGPSGIDIHIEEDDENFSDGDISNAHQDTADSCCCFRFSSSPPEPSVHRPPSNVLDEITLTHVTPLLMLDAVSQIREDSIFSNARLFADAIDNLRNVFSSSVNVDDTKGEVSIDHATVQILQDEIKDLYSVSQSVYKRLNQMFIDPIRTSAQTEGFDRFVGVTKAYLKSESNANMEKQKKARLHLAVGLEAVNNRKYSEAEREFKLALHECRDVCHDIESGYLNEEDLNELEKKNLRNIRGLHAETLYELGQLKWELVDFKEAITYLEEACTIQENIKSRKLLTTRQKLTELYSMTHRNQEAAKQLEQILGLQQGNNTAIARTLRLILEVVPENDPDHHRYQQQLDAITRRRPIVALHEEAPCLCFNQPKTETNDNKETERHDAARVVIEEAQPPDFLRCQECKELKICQGCQELKWSSCQIEPKCIRAFNCDCDGWRRLRHPEFHHYLYYHNSRVLGKGSTSKVCPGKYRTQHGPAFMDVAVKIMAVQQGTASDDWWHRECSVFEQVEFDHDRRRNLVTRIGTFLPQYGGRETQDGFIILQRLAHTLEITGDDTKTDPNDDILRYYRELKKEDIPKRCRDVICGLQALHNLTPIPLAHRDIKPSNIFVTDDGQKLVLGDFGRAHGTDIRQTVQHGTVLYRPIEPDPDHAEADDIFSLGLCFYYIMTKGKHLFIQEDEATTHGRYALNFEMENPHQDAKVDNAFNNLVLRMCAKNVAERPTINDLCDHPFLWPTNAVRTMLTSIRQLFYKTTETLFLDQNLPVPDAGHWWNKLARNQTGQNPWIKRDWFQGTTPWESCHPQCPAKKHLDENPGDLDDFEKRIKGHRQDCKKSAFWTYINFGRRQESKRRSIFGLIKCIRDEDAHFDEAGRFETRPAMHKYFMELFPWLPWHVYKWLNSIKDRQGVREKVAHLRRQLKNPEVGGAVNLCFEKWL